MVPRTEANSRGAWSLSFRDRRPKDRSDHSLIFVVAVIRKFVCDAVDYESMGGQSHTYRKS